jgi:hypothetical protein
MTRSTPLTQAGAGKRKARATAGAGPKPVSMTFRVFEDNGGGYHWTVDLVARRDTRGVRDDLDAERWFDEGGSLGSEAVRR